MNIERFDRWVRCVCRNKSYSYFRERKRRYSRTVLLQEEGWTDQYFVTCVSIDDYLIEIADGNLYACICKLSERRKAIIMLHYFAGFTDAETGNLMKIPRTTVHYNRKQSLTELRKELGEC